MPDRRRPLVAGNWKMNGLGASLAEIAAIRDGVAAGRAGSAEIVLCPPATLLMAAAELCEGGPIGFGGQDCGVEASGAHTGDISAEMLKDAGAAYVIVGHSERRADHGETDSLVRAKAAAGLRAGLSVILCVGETRAEREAGEAMSKVSGQLAQSLPADVPATRLVIAYEPVWAIGSGVTPTPQDVAAMHGFLRERLEHQLPGKAAIVRILYGGSVKPANAAELLGLPDVDGALVGGASLKATEFLQIAHVYQASEVTSSG
ncbi:triose-phosphate isomerase [Methylovirgula sp. HY1]|uniref:triose-phosphate isomerase n=1 Tax=Methylovirgula sp. HY1 TaxID=2822761 RepID=UPI001C5AACD3|nr:triose-phosphate isomerase [Methylovirgula sp. HY1]QXX73941.1 Triosephosphate isomerase [Methylovirgula sp. HY1]